MKLDFVLLLPVTSIEGKVKMTVTENQPFIELRKQYDMISARVLKNQAVG